MFLTLQQTDIYNLHINKHTIEVSLVYRATTTLRSSNLSHTNKKFYDIPINEGVKLHSLNIKLYKSCKMLLFAFAFVYFIQKHTVHGIYTSYEKAFMV